MSLRRTAPPALLACLAVLAALTAAPPVVAAKPHPTKVFVSLKFPAFHGSLKSARSCLGGRRVSIFRRRAGKTTKLGTGTSNGAGNWKVAVGKNLTSGEYFAAVTATGGCGAGRSKTLTVD